ncbi:uncharacterized protein LOC120006712 isoform X2 [Tripterygium wilfordii]|nr:uncharacterized protein LOC120006712 isoform X2 [Tripterygium wilfordii]
METQMHDESMDKPKVRKAKNYTVAEDLILIAAWEHTSEDVVIGTDQAKEQYWTRVWREYLSNASSYPYRPEKSIINRFSIIRTKCLKFSGIVQSIEYANPSGMTEQDKLNQAIKAWSTEEKERGVFKFLHCYQALKNSPKWITEVVHPSLSRSTAASESINLGDDVSASGHVELERPVGRKAGKERMKNKKIKVEDSGESQTSINFEKSQELMQKFHEQKMDVIMQDSKKMDEYLQLKREKLELDREHKEEKVMTIDMSNLNEMQRKYIEMKQWKIFEKAFNK